MTDDADLIRHLESSDEAMWNPVAAPPIDLNAITSSAPPELVRRPADPVRGAKADQRPRGRRWGGLQWRAGGLLVGATACVAVGMAIGAFVIGGGSASPGAAPPTVAATPTERIDLRPLEDAPVGARAVANVFASAGSEHVELRIAGLPPAPAGSFYEVWALGKQGRMASLGSVAVDSHGDGHASMLVPVSLDRFPVIDISIETADGNPAHSGHSLLRAPV